MYIITRCNHVTNDLRNNIWTLFLTANNNIHGLGEN
jgi:hypothetical protein